MRSLGAALRDSRHSESLPDGLATLLLNSGSGATSPLVHLHHQLEQRGLLEKEHTTK